MRQSIFANVSIKSNLSNAKITTIIIFQIISMRSNKNAKIKTKNKYFVFEWISNQKEIANSNFWQRKKFRVRMISFRLKITFFEKFSIKKNFVFEWFRFHIFDCTSNVIVDEYNNIDNARIFEFDLCDNWTKTYSKIWNKINNNDDFRCLNSFIVKQWRRFSMFKFDHCRKFRARFKWNKN